MDKYEISRHRYRELYNFCLQYSEFKERLAECYSICSAYNDGMPKNDRLPDSTASRAEQAIKYRRLCNIIEQAAMEADSELYPWIIRAVTEGLSWDDLRPPCGINQFYKLRRKFFYFLSLKK